LREKEKLENNFSYCWLASSSSSSLIRWLFFSFALRRSKQEDEGSKNIYFFFHFQVAILGKISKANYFVSSSRKVAENKFRREGKRGGGAARAIVSSLHTHTHTHANTQAEAEDDVLRQIFAHNKRLSQLITV